MTDTTTLGQRIAEGRRKLGLSQEAFGDRLGVSRQAASKWESDAAVPEIDKLITMSRLFGVSIGWLLGVEDPEAPTDGTLSEEQLTAVTELLCRYPTPCPERKSRKWLVSAGAAGLVLALSLGITGLFLPQSKPADASGDTRLAEQVSSLTAQNALLQTQIQDLTDQQAEKEKLQSQLMQEQSQKIEALKQLLGDIDAAPDDAVPPPETLHPAVGILDSWVISPKAYTKSNNVVLRFLALTDQEVSSAQFVAMINGNEVQSQPCQSTLGGYSAELELTALNGYEYYFVFTNQDGAMTFLLLTGHGLSDLATAMRPAYSFIPREKADVANGSRSFWLASPRVTLEMPTIIDENLPAAWQDLRIVYRCNGEIAQEMPLGEYLDQLSDHARRLEFTLPTVTFPFQDTGEGSLHSLQLAGAVSADGQSFTFSLPVGSWVIKAGKLTATPQ